MVRSDRTPCAVPPDEAEVKTIGIEDCRDCGASWCWLEYLRWEVRAGITLNHAHHHLVSELS